MVGDLADLRRVTSQSVPDACPWSAHAMPTRKAVARQLGLPCVVAVDGLDDVAAGRDILLDGSAGRVFVRPDPETAVSAVTAYRASADRAARWTGLGATADGHRVEVLANVQDGTGAWAARRGPAEGVGLFRTELCFLDRESEPGAESLEPPGLRWGQFCADNQCLEVRDLGEAAEAGHPELAVGGDENTALGAVDCLALHSGDRRIRRREAMLYRNTVRTEIGEIDDELAQHAQCPVVHGGQRAAAHASSEQQNSNPSAVSKNLGGEQRRGDHGQLVVGDLLGNEARCESLIEVYGFGSVQQARRGGGNSVLLSKVHSAAVIDARLERRALERDRSAVYPFDQLAISEHSQIPADGLCSDPEFGSQRAHFDPAAGPGVFQNFRLTRV